MQLHITEKEAQIILNALENEYANSKSKEVALLYYDIRDVTNSEFAHETIADCEKKESLSDEERDAYEWAKQLLERVCKRKAIVAREERK